MKGGGQAVPLRPVRPARQLPSPFVAGVAASALGAALLSLPARHFRVDHPAANGLGESLAYTTIYALALALLVVGWRQVVRNPPSLRAAMLAGVAVNLVALAAPPFLSLDCLCYAAIGRAMARFHGSAYVPLQTVLPPGDPFLTILPETWRLQGSAYSGGFNQLARLVSIVTGDDLALAIRAFQLIALAAVTLTAWLVARAVGVSRPEARGATAALVLFCPLTIVEATINAHNDALLALSVAAWALLVTLGSRRAGLVALAAGVAVKASAILLIVVHGVELVAARFGARVRPRTLAIGLGAVGVVGLVGLLVAWQHIPGLRLVLALVGGPDEAPHCTRSIECIPRAFLFWVVHLPRAAWLVGLLFRVAGAVWLATIGWRAARQGPGATLASAATALSIYYLLLHGFMQSWYLLSLVPLLPFAEAPVRRALEVFLVSSLVYYVLFVPLQGDQRVWVIAAKELAEGLVVITPPALVLLRRRSPPPLAMQAAA